MASTQLKAMTDELKRCERYLGLRKTNHPITDDVKGQGRFEPPILIVFDADSDGKHRLTEIGITILDTKELQNTDPGVHAEGWLRSVKTIHIRVTEDTPKPAEPRPGRNLKRFALGRAEGTCIREDLMDGLLCRLLQDPCRWDLSNPYGRHRNAKRNLVFVAHASHKKLEYLGKIGFDPRQHPHAIDMIDTQDLDRAIRREACTADDNGDQSRSLCSILRSLGVQMPTAQDAGLDAYFTMQALLALTTKSAREGIADRKDDEWATEGDGGDGTIAHIEGQKERMQRWMRWFAPWNCPPWATEWEQSGGPIVRVENYRGRMKRWIRESLNLLRMIDM